MHRRRSRLPSTMTTSPSRQPRPCAGWRPGRRATWPPLTGPTSSPPITSSSPITSPSVLGCTVVLADLEPGPGPPARRRAHAGQGAGARRERGSRLRPRPRDGRPARLVEPGRVGTRRPQQRRRPPRPCRRSRRRRRPPEEPGAVADLARCAPGRRRRNPTRRSSCSTRPPASMSATSPPTCDRWPPRRARVLVSTATSPAPVSGMAAAEPQPGRRAVATCGSTS